jgi:microcystin-dependent protein
MSNSEAFFIDGTMGFKSKLIFGLISLNPVAIGTIDYPELQSDCAIAIGDHAGFYNQGECAIAIGESAGRTNQSSLAIAIGSGAGESSQSQYAIALGLDAGMLTQGTNAIAIGSEAGNSDQGENTIAIGKQAGSNQQQEYGIAIGQEAGRMNQSTNAIAIGYQAGYTNQSINALALGHQAGHRNQASQAIAVGYQAGYTNQASQAIALGSLAGYSDQKSNAIALGFQAGQQNQASQAIALGYQAGQQNQGENAIAIGKFAGQNNQPVNSIVLNASGSSMSGVTQASACYVHPIRLNSSSSYASNNLLYDTTTREVVYQPNPVVVGDIKFSFLSSNHNNWVLCNGQEYLISQYPQLYALIGTTYGGIPGVKYNVPDTRGRVLGGVGSGPGLSNRVIGQAVGAETHTLTTSEMPSHTHTGTTDPAGWAAASYSTTTAFTDSSADDTGSHTHTFTTDPTGGGLAHNNMQPTLFIGNVFIYAGY